jgi:threonine/homoserine/homoserine lactone efflux protein
MGAVLLARSARGGSPTAAVPGGSAARPFRTGLATNLLNPKIAVFYTAVLPSLVPRGASEGLWLALLVATHAALSVLWLAGAAAIVARGRKVLARRRFTRIIDAVAGTALVGFGFELARGTR